MSCVLTEQVTWRIGATNTLLARLTSADGSGAATGVDGEGSFIQAAQVSTITCRVYDRSSATPDTALSPSPTITSATLSTPVTTNVIWTVDSIGYNWLYNLTTGLIDTAGHVYRVVIDITLSTGTVLPPFAFEGPAVDLSP